MSLLSGSSERAFNAENWGYPPHNRASFQQVQQLVPTIRLSRGSDSFRPFSQSIKSVSGITYLGLGGQSRMVQQMLDDTYTDAFLVTKDGKLLAEDIEDMDPVQAEAVKATGASWFQWLNYSVQPQVMPRMIGLAMYRFDINFRESAVLGIVGAGGIGATLLTSFDRYEFSSSAAILLIIIGIVMVVEYSSGYIRKWVQ